MHWYFGPWLHHTNPQIGRIGPSPCLHSFDFAPLEQRSERARAGTLNGIGIFLRETAIVDSNYEFLGEGGFDLALSLAHRQLLGGSGTTLGEQLISLHAAGDPTGVDNGLCPIAPSRRQWILRAGPFAIIRPATRQDFLNIVPRLQHVYARLRAEHRGVSDVHLKWLGAQQIKYRLGDDYRLILREESKDDIPVEPRTSYSDNFDGANSGTLGIQLTWTELVGTWGNASNRAEIQAESGSIRHVARADHALSDDDHECEVDLVVLTSSGNTCGGGLTARMPATATDSWIGLIQFFNSASADEMFTQKSLSGSRTTIAGGTAQTISLPDTVLFDITGDAYTSKFNGSTVHSGTHTEAGLYGNVRGGMQGFRNTSTAVSMDDWSIDDGITAGTRRQSMALLGVGV